MTAEGADQESIPIKSRTAFAPFAPRVSADGTLVAFESFDPFGHATVHVVSVNGGAERNLTPSGLEDRAPSWAPAGDQIVLSRGSLTTGVYALYIVDTSNGTAQQLTTPPPGASDSEPAWSSSGSQIAFTRIKRSGNYDVYSIQTTPSAKVRRLTTDPAEDGGPVWSPDETKILFRSSRSGSYELWTMNADGSQQTELTPDPKGIDVAADWAPQQVRAFTTPRRSSPRALARAANFYCVTPPGAAPTTGGHDVINGTPFDDFLCGGGGPDALHGGDGNDQIDGGSGNDRRTNGGILAGDAGDDLIFARALSAPTGDCDYVDGGSGLNTAWVDTSTVPCGKTTRHKDVWVNVSVTRPP
jgi:dipeptidyl aminopeptidase/acylaminoacyl peptidase